MDKSTLSNYGWIVIAVLVLAVMIALATPFGSYIKTGVENTTQGLFDTSEKAMNVVGMSAGDGSFESGSGTSTPTKDPALNPSGTIPENASYYVNAELCPDCRATYGITGNTCFRCGWQFTSGQQINSFPSTMQNGDVYTFGDYQYIYDATTNGWNVRAMFNTKTECGAILESINNKPIKSLNGTFEMCGYLETPPTIPSSVISMRNTFKLSSITSLPDLSKCTQLEDMTGTFDSCGGISGDASEFVIPNNVKYMDAAFYGCNITKAPTIPSGVTSMNNTFCGCYGLSGTLIVPIACEGQWIADIDAPNNALTIIYK